MLIDALIEVSSEAEVKEQYQVKITNRFVALEKFDNNEDMN
jgi:hypothetical protein